MIMLWEGYGRGAGKGGNGMAKAYDNLVDWLEGACRRGAGREC